jgi:hypothetical protein
MMSLLLAHYKIISTVYVSINIQLITSQFSSAFHHGYARKTFRKYIFFLISNVLVANTLPETYELSEPVVEVFWDRKCPIIYIL